MKIFFKEEQPYFSKPSPYKGKFNFWNWPCNSIGNIYIWISKCKKTIKPIVTTHFIFKEGQDYNYVSLRFQGENVSFVEVLDFVKYVQKFEMSNLEQKLSGAIFVNSF